jgi:hypothetical protein
MFTNSEESYEMNYAPETKLNVNWADTKSKISKYFSVKEATFLPSWGIHHFPSETEKENILKMAAVMDKIRDFLGTPITVSVWIRPKAVNCLGSVHHGQDYNAFVKGAEFSAHIKGLAVDWVSKDKCDDIRAKLMPELENFGICIEDLPGSNWVHTDIGSPRPNGGRCFKPNKPK